MLVMCLYVSACASIMCCIMLHSSEIVWRWPLSWSPTLAIRHEEIMSA